MQIQSIGATSFNSKQNRPCFTALKVDSSVPEELSDILLKSKTIEAISNKYNIKASHNNLMFNGSPCLELLISKIKESKGFISKLINKIMPKTTYKMNIFNDWDAVEHPRSIKEKLVALTPQKIDEFVQKADAAKIAGKNY